MFGIISAVLSAGICDFTETHPVVGGGGWRSSPKYFSPHVELWGIAVRDLALRNLWKQAVIMIMLRNLQ